MPPNFHRYKNTSSSWEHLIINSQYTQAENAAKSSSLQNLLHLNELTPCTHASRLSNTNNYLNFNNYINNSTNHCLLDISILDNLNSLGCLITPSTYSMPQAISNPRNMAVPELLGFLDTESYSSNTGEDLVTLNPYLLICNLQEEIITYDALTHGSKFINHFLLDLIKNFDNETTPNIIFIIAHNFSGHDALLLIESFTSLINESACTCTIVYHSGNVYNLTIKWNTSSNTLIQARFQCSLILFQSSLENVCNSFGNQLRNMPMPHNAVDSLQVLNSNDMSILLNHLNSEEDNALLTSLWYSTNSITILDYANHYCSNDVNILEYVYSNFNLEYQDAIKTGEISNYDFITISRLAQTTWSSLINFNEHFITNIPNSTPIGNYLITSYYGGNCEVYNGFLDSGTLCYYFDYPGMYSIAIRQPIPIGVPTYIDCTQVKLPHLFISALHNSGICAYLTVNFATPPTCRIPILPYNASLSDNIPKLMFCAGQARGSYFSYELEHAIKEGYNILNIYHGYAFNSYNTLKPYSNYMTQINEVSNTKNDKIRTLIYNLLSNSLYGKFGIQRHSRSLFTPIHTMSTIPNLNQFYPIDESMSIACVHIKDTSSATNLAVAAAVASWGRIILSTGVSNVLLSNPRSKLMYVDTDSIFFQSPNDIETKNMWNNLNWSTQAIYNDANFLASNFYILNDLNNLVTVNINGVNSDHIDLNCFNNASSQEFTLLISNIDQWNNASLRSILINSISNTIIPYDSPNRRLVINNGQWTGNTLPYNFSSITPRTHTNFTSSPRYYNTPISFELLENIQSIPTQHGEEYRYNNMSLSPLPSDTPLVSTYSISYSNDQFTWTTLYYLVGWLSSNKNSNRIGIISGMDTPGTEITLTSEYFSYPDPYNRIGHEEFELHMNTQVIYYAERYSLDSQETSQMFAEESLAVRLIAYYVS